MQNKADIYQATTENFSALVLENSFKGPVLVHFWAPWVGPCLMLKPRLQTLSQAYAGQFLLVEMNTDEHKEPARSFGINSLPYLKLYRRGEVVHDFRGGQSEAEFRKILDKYVSSSTLPLHQQAVLQYRDGHLDSAFSLFQQAMEKHPDELSIPLDYAKTLMASGRIEQAEEVLINVPSDIENYERARDLLAHVRFRIAGLAESDLTQQQLQLEADPENQELNFQYAASLLLQDQVEACIEQLFLMLQQDRHYRDELARHALLALFNMLGESDQRVRAYRSRLHNILAA